MSSQSKRKRRRQRQHYKYDHYGKRQPLTWWERFFIWIGLIRSNKEG